MHATRRHWAHLGLFLTVSSAAWAASPDSYRLEKHLPLAAGGSFVLRNEASGVKVRGVDAGAGSEAVVLITSNRQDFAALFNVRIETPRPDRVQVVIERKSHGPSSWFGGNNDHTRVEITLPRSVATEIESSGGGIDIADLTGKVTAESSGGGVAVAHLGGGAKLSSSGGAIDADDVSGDLEASSSGGGVEVREVHGRVVADSSGGAVSVAFAAGNAHGGKLESSGGGVEVRLDPAVGLEVDASSSGGSVACDLPITVRGRVGRDSIHGTLNGGGPLLELSSSGGGIDISAR